MSYRDACAYLGIEPKLSIVSGNVGSPKWRPSEPKQVSSNWRDMAIRFLDYSIKTLWTEPGKASLEWLRVERGFTEDTIRHFRLGWNPVDVWRDRAAWGLPEEISDKTSKPKKLWLPSGLVIPLGEVARLKIRRPNPGDGPRYYFLPGSSTEPMVCPGGKGGAVVIVESELDAILINQEAKDLVAAHALGSANIRPDTNTTGILQAADLILVALDSDNAGVKESWQWWVGQFPQSRRWPPIGGKDPSAMRKAGMDVRVWIEAGIQEYSPARQEKMKDELQTNATYHSHRGTCPEPSVPRRLRQDAKMESPTHLGGVKCSYCAHLEITGKRGECRLSKQEKTGIALCIDCSSFAMSSTPLPVGCKQDSQDKLPGCA